MKRHAVFRTPRGWLPVLGLLAGLALPWAGVAQETRVWLTVLDAQGKGIPNLQLQLLGPGSPTSPTDKDGVTTLLWPAGKKGGDSVELRVGTSRKIWVFLSPWDGRITLPASPTDGVKIVLGERGNKEILANPQAARAFAEALARELAEKLAKEGDVAPADRKTAALKTVSEQYGLSQEDIDHAVQAWLKAAKDPYEKGLADLLNGQYAQASAQLEESLEAREAQEAETKRQVVEAARLLGLSRYQEGKYREAVAAFRKALARQPDDIHLLNYLTNSLLDAGEYPAAEQQARKALAFAVQTFGEEDRETLTSKNNLAETLRSQGDLAGARKLQEEMLPALERLLGKEHPDTLKSKNNLSSTLRSQGDLAGARKLQEEVLVAQERLLGKEHPDTLKSKYNLAETLLSQGDLAGARKLQEEVLAARERLLGKEHPDTLKSKSDLAETLRSQGDLARARKLQEEVLVAEQRLLGKEHPDTLRSQNNLAETLRSQGDLAGARKLQEEVLAALERLLGKEHPDTLTSKSNLAATLGSQGDLAGARKLQEEVLAARERLLGPRQSSTTISSWNLLMTLAQLKDMQAIQEIVSKLLWLLGAAENTLSADQKQIRDFLLKLRDGHPTRRPPRSQIGPRDISTNTVPAPSSAHPPPLCYNGQSRHSI